MSKRKKVTLKDVIGIIDTPLIEGRFKEIISTEKIVDTETNTEYDGLVDEDLLILINKICEENEKYKLKYGEIN